MTALLWSLAILLMLAGLIGTVVPGLPGVWVIFCGFLLAAWIDGFERVGWGSLALLGVLTLLGIVADLLATSLGARRYGASWQATAGAAVGALVGLFWGLPGLLLGPLAGAVAGEIWAGRDLTQAGRVGAGAGVGVIVGLVVKLGLAFAMIGIFVLAFVL